LGGGAGVNRIHHETLNDSPEHGAAVVLMLLQVDARTGEEVRVDDLDPMDSEEEAD
jgi:hypothetical protein